MKIKIILLFLCLGVIKSSFAILNTPNQVAPNNGATNQNVNAILDWDPVTGVTGYRYQYDTSPTFNSPNLFSGTLGTVSQATLANLKFNTTYYWKVKAIKTTAPADSSNWSSSFSFTTLDNINNLLPANGALNQNPNAILDWEIVSGVAGYLYQYDTSPTFTSPNLFNGAILGSSQVTLANLNFNTTYYWRVRAYTTTDTSSYGAVWSFKTLDIITNMLPANGATNTNISTLLDWDPVSGTIGYLYQYDTSPTFNTPNLFNGTINGISQVTLNALQFGVTYFWRVRAYHATDTSSYGATWSFTTLGTFSYIAPANNSVNQAANVTLDWDALTGISGYIYQYDTSATFNSPILYTGTLGATSQINAANLRFNTTYFWRVRAFNSVDTTAWQQVWSFSTMESFNNLLPANGSVNQFPNVTLDWSAVGGILGYIYQYDTAATFNSPLLFTGTLGNISQVNTANLLFDTKYYWRVRAFHATDTTAWQQVWSFNTFIIISHLTPANGATGTNLGPILDWSTVNGILGYQYRYSEDANFATATYGVLPLISQVTLSGLLYGTQYFWSVRAFNAVDTTVWSLPWNFTTNYQMASAPALISPNNGASNQPLTGVQLSIGSVVNATDYQYQLSTNSNFTTYTYYSAAGLTQALGTLNASTTYYWRARGHNSAGNSPWASAYSFSTVLGAPPAPINAGPSNAAINIDWLGATINWSQVAGATGYVLLYDDNASFSSPTTINTADNFYATGMLNPNTTYYWQVQAVNASGSSSFSAVWSFTTGPVPAPMLLSPSNLATGVPINSVTLSWSAVTAATSYYLEYATNVSFTGAIAVTVTGTSQALPTLANNQIYYWRVYANYNSFSSVYSNVYSFTTEIGAVLLAPVLISPANLATNVPINGINLTWQAAVGAISYNWELSTSPSFTTPVNGNTSNLNNLIPVLLNNTTYYWHVSSVGATTTSAWSSTFSFTTAIPAPAVPTLIAPANTSTNIDWMGTMLDWSSVATATNYVVLFDDNINFISPLTFNTTDDFYNTGMLLPNTTYFWKVHASNAAGNSAYSTIWSFTTGLIPAPVLNSPANNSIGLAVTGITLQWLPVIGATDYYVEYANNPAFTGAIGATVVSTSYNLPTLSNNQTYYWHVYAGYNAYSSNYSSSFSFTTIGINVLTAPQLLSPADGAVNVPIIGTSITWQSVTDALSYEWELSADANFTTVVSGNTSALSELMITLLNNTTYYWHVKSIGATTNSAWSSTFSFTTAIVAPIVPVQIAPMDASINIDWLGAMLDWTPVSGASSYVILFDDNINFTSASTFTTTDDFYNTGMLVPNTTYYWKVQASNAGGSSAFSSVWSFTTGLIPAPVLNSPANNSTGLAISGISLQWLPVVGATDYYVEYANNPGFAGAIGVAVTSNSYILPILNNNQTYYWHVYAGYNAYSSNYSADFSFTTIGANILAAPQLLSPANAATAVPIVGTSITWQSVTDALSYDWEVSTDAAFTTIIFSSNTNITNALLSGLIDNTTYFWHVRSADADTVSDWSSTFNFTTDILSAINNLGISGLQVFSTGQQLIITAHHQYQGAMYQVYNVSGQVIKQDVILNSQYNIDISSWSKGVYFVRVFNAQSNQNYKILVQ